MEEEEKEEKLKKWRVREIVPVNCSIDDPEYEQTLYEVLDQKVRHLLDLLKKNDPQIDMNGFRNVWIAKPNCKYYII